MLGDYYPLTPYSINTGDWIAWQFDRPEIGGGMIQAFRREQNDKPARLFRLSGLVPSARYHVTDLDGGPTRNLTGSDLMKKGLTIEIKTTPGAALLIYRKVERKG
jgi:alpha-galactosidase